MLSTCRQSVLLLGELDTLWTVGWGKVRKAELVRECFLEVVTSWPRPGRMYKWEQKR